MLRLALLTGFFTLCFLLCYGFIDQPPIPKFSASNSGIVAQTELSQMLDSTDALPEQNSALSKPDPVATTPEQLPVASPSAAELKTDPTRRPTSNPAAFDNNLHQEHQRQRDAMRQEALGQGMLVPLQVKRRTVRPDEVLPRDAWQRVSLEWDVLAATTLDEIYQPTFPACLQAVAGEPVTIRGFMCPLAQAGLMNQFLLLEFPLGCYFCLTPEPNNIVCVELADGKAVPMDYNYLQITGNLVLNTDNPEDFLFHIVEAELQLVD